MFVAAFTVLVLVGLLLFALVRNANSLPKSFLKFLGYFLLSGSTLELLVLGWVVVCIAFGDVSWGLSMNEFWKQELSGIYFVKEWLYSWVWNDALNFFLAYLPAILFLAMRTTATTLVGLWALSASRGRRPLYRLQRIDSFFEIEGALEELFCVGCRTLRT